MQNCIALWLCSCIVIVRVRTHIFFAHSRARYKDAPVSAGVLEGASVQTPREHTEAAPCDTRRGVR